MKAKSSKKRRLLKALAFCLLVVFAVIGWSVLPLILAEPTIKVDYVAEYNRIAKPRDFDPEQNAARHYDGLFSEFTPLPEVFHYKFQDWPATFNADELEALKKWGEDSKTALELLQRAATCPYWWSEAKSSDGSLPGVKLPYVAKQRELAWGVLLLAKFKASQGDADTGLKHLIDLNMMGIHRAGAETLLEQLIGLAICELSYQGVLDVLGRCDVKLGSMNRVRQILSFRISQMNVPRFAQGELMHAMDCIQRTFTDDGAQDGKLIPRELYKTKKDGGLHTEPLSYPAAVWICLTHPSRKETLESYQLLYKTLNQLAEKTPWELHAQLTNYVDELRPLVEQNYFLRDGVPAFAGVIETCWRGKTHGEAVGAVLAILIHQAEKGKSPDSLDRLVAADYLNGVPTDPYSGKPLVYKTTGGSFTLYSVGADFSDNGGVARSWTDTNDGGDRVFWPSASASEDE